MNSIADTTVIIQTSPESVPATPPWLGEVALLIRHLDKQGVLEAISQQVRFARRRFGRYEVIDTLSRFLAALSPEPVEALRSLVLADLLARRLCTEEPPGGLFDRQGNYWLVFDVDGTREAARQRALPQTPDRPAAQRRLRPLCAPGYTGRKRGEVVRTRTVVSQANPLPMARFVR